MTTRIGFSTPKFFNPVSWLVRTVTGSKASHCYFVYRDLDFDMDMVMEAHELGFRLTPFEHFKRYNHIVALFVPKAPLDVGLKSVARKYLGTMYDYAGLFGGVVNVVGRWFKRKWNNPFRGSKNVFCSEAVCRAMKESPGFEDFKEDPDNVDPQDLLNYFVAGNGTEVRDAD